MLNKIFINTFLLLCVSVSSFAESRPKVRIGAFDFFPLHYRCIQTSKVKGKIIDQVRKVCKASGLDCEFSIVPAARLYRDFKELSLDVIITVGTKEIETISTSSDWNYKETGGIFSKGKLDKVPRSTKDLYGKSIIIVNKWKSPYKVFKKLNDSKSNVTIYKPNNVLTSIKMLLKNRSNMLWGVSSFLKSHEELNFKKNNIQYYPIIDLPISLWINNKNKKSLEILNLINKGFRDLKL